MRRRKRPTPAELGLTAGEGRILGALKTPQRIQEFVVGLHANFERDGDTLRSVRGVLHHREAHCLEAAFVAACALWLQGEPPLLMDLTAAKGDADHVVTLFRRNGCWGAISKSNHAWLRWRDPVYRDLRELAMSYFHEYFNNGRKTLRTYSASFDLRRFAPETWITDEENCWDVGAALDDARHYRLIKPAQMRWLMPPDATVLRADDLVQYESRDRKTARKY
ncbi:MAG: hypothetical protein J0H97_09975 [Alphaproteobacteria bacterium]|jgi:hypothetical protein|nr:hypothetical protein [Alphaproteobacteria bacterium]